MLSNIFSFAKVAKGGSHQKATANDDSNKAGNKALEQDSLPVDVFLDAGTILKDPKISLLVRKIRTLSGVSDEYFDAYYLPVIEVCAIYCQSAPASKENHHSYHFGLITHLVETALYAVRARLQFVYKVTSKEEDIDNYKNIYTYAVFVAAMNHDMGKVIADNRYFIRANTKDKYQPWSPLSSFPPAEKENIQYKVERKINKQGKFIYKYNSHSIMNTSLLCRTVPSCGWAWISSLHPKLEVDIFHAVSGDYENADVIGKSVKEADALSSKASMDNKVTSLLNGENTGGSVPPMLSMLKKIISDPIQHSLTVNNTRFTTLVKKNGLIYIAGAALEKSVKDEAKNFSLTLPSGSNKLEGMITDHYTLPAASGDTMWWVSFTPEGKQVDSKKKDVKCFVFDADIYDSNDMLPEASEVNVKRSIKSMSDEERKKESKEIIKSVSKDEAEKAKEDNGADDSIVKKRNSNLKVGGEGLNNTVTTVTNVNAPSSSTAKDTPKTNSFAQSIKEDSGNTGNANNLTEDKLPPESKKQKPAFKGVKAIDLLKLIELGEEGSTEQKKSTEKPGTPKSKPKQDNKSKSTANKNSVPTPQKENDGKAGTPTKTKVVINQSKAEEKTPEQREHQNSESHTKPTGGKANKALAPKQGVGSSVFSLMPSLATLQKAKEDDPNTPKLGGKLTEDVKDNIDSAPHTAALHNVEEVQLSEPPVTTEIIKDVESVPYIVPMIDAQPPIDPNDGYLTGIPPEYAEQNLIPYSDQWLEVPEEYFNAVTSDEQVKFRGDDDDVGHDPLVKTKMFSSPLWAPNINPKSEDALFIDELFGVLQQAINNGLQFNRIGSQLYIVPHGIFLVSPSSFDNPDFPLSTRGSYYKDKIRNSSYLARAGLDKNKSVVTGRVLRTKKTKSAAMKVKTTGALNGFYLVTGNRNKLNHNNLVIKPTAHLIFDSYSVNGIVKLD